MLHRRLVDSLDSSAPLLFVEAIHGSGKRTVLRQWESGGGNRHGEIHLLFDAPRLPSDRVELIRMYWGSLQHQFGPSLQDLPEDDAQLEDAMQRGLRGLRRPVAVAIHDADHLGDVAFDMLMRLSEVGTRLIFAGADLSALQQLAQRRGVYYAALGGAGAVAVARGGSGADPGARGGAVRGSFRSAVQSHRGASRPDPELSDRPAGGDGRWPAHA